MCIYIQFYMFTYYSYKFIYTAIYIYNVVYILKYIYICILFIFILFIFILYIYSYIYIYIHIVINIYIYIHMWQGPFGIMRPSSFLIPFVSILVSLSVPNLSPYFSISIAILLSGCFRSKESPLVSRSSLLSPLLSVLRSGGFGTGLKSHLFSYSSLYFTLTCGCSLWVLPGHSMLLVLCLSMCLSPLFSPTHALTSLSLSLAVLLSRCLFGHMILSGSSLALSCSLQRVSLIPSPLLLLGEEWISWPLVFLPAFFPLFRSHSLTLSLYHVLPYLPSYLSPTCLLILSPLPCFFPGLRHLGRRG